MMPQQMGGMMPQQMGGMMPPQMGGMMPQQMGGMMSQMGGMMSRMGGGMGGGGGGMLGMASMSGNPKLMAAGAAADILKSPWPWVVIGVLVIGLLWFLTSGGMTSALFDIFTMPLQIFNMGATMLGDMTKGTLTFAGDAFKNVGKFGIDSLGSGVKGIGKGFSGAGKGIKKMFSDRRVKSDIMLVGKTDHELHPLPVYKYKYTNSLGDSHSWIGVVAQDVEKSPVDASAVTENSEGIKLVDYSALIGHTYRGARLPIAFSVS